MSIDWIARAQQITPNVRNLIEGRWCEVSGERLEKRAPRNGRILATYGAGNAADVDVAVMSARRGRGSAQALRPAPRLTDENIKSFYPELDVGLSSVRIVARERQCSGEVTKADRGLAPCAVQCPGATCIIPQ